MASNAQATQSQNERNAGPGGTLPTPTPSQTPPAAPPAGADPGDVPQPGTPRMRTIVARKFTHMLKSSLPANWRVQPSAASVAHAARQQGIPVDQVQATVVVAVPDSALGAAYCQWLWAQPSSDEWVLPMAMASSSFEAECGEGALRRFEVSMQARGHPFVAHAGYARDNTLPCHLRMVWHEKSRRQ